MSSELKALLEKQRGRRNQVMTQLATIAPVPAMNRRPQGMKNSEILIYISLGFILNIGIFLMALEAVQVSKPLPVFRPSPMALPTIQPTQMTFLTETEKADGNYMVCTNVSAGHLHVRLAPGEGSAVRGYLTEGQTVQPAISKSSKLDTQLRSDGSSWIRLRSPIEGWVNNRFICEHK